MRTLIAGGLLMLCGCAAPPEEVARGVRFLAGPVNGLLVEGESGRALFYGDAGGELAAADALLVTHHRRDVLAFADGAGREVIAPAAERALFAEPKAYWSAYKESRIHDYAQQSSKVLTEGMRVDRWTADGDRLALLDGGLDVEVLATPGYTRGAVSYLFERGGKRIAVTGDLIYGDGQILDLFSLQDAIPEADTRGYHGYAARAADVIESLRKVAGWEPDVIVPARGPLIENPQEAIGKLIARLQELFQLYYRTDALRWYWGEDNLRVRARRVLSDAQIDWMPTARELREIPPRWMHKFGTSRLIVSDTGNGFLIDCGSEDVIERIRDLQVRGVVKRVEGIFVTHYHDDHTDWVERMSEECDCPVYSGPETADILERPRAYRMPAQTDQAISDIVILKQDEVLEWQEYRLTYTYFPGQALLHGGLRLEREGGEKYFFIGDSFSPTGLDDYCILNRHFLHPGLGHFRCLDEIEAAGPEYWLVNQHIEPIFRYSPEQLDFMRETLEGKRRVAAELVPYDDPNFGLDEQWMRLYPYEQAATAGEEFELWALVFNHSPTEQTFRVTLDLPEGWTGETELEITAAPRTEGRASTKVRVGDQAAGLTVIPADVAWGELVLPSWVEAMVEVGGK